MLISSLPKYNKFYVENKKTSRPPMGRKELFRVATQIAEKFSASFLARYRAPPLSSSLNAPEAEIIALFTGLHLPPALCKTIRRSSFPSLRFVVVLLFPRILYTPFAFFVKSLLYKPPQNS